MPAQERLTQQERWLKSRATLEPVEAGIENQRLPSGRHSQRYGGKHHHQRTERRQQKRLELLGGPRPFGAKHQHGAHAERSRQNDGQRGQARAGKPENVETGDSGGGQRGERDLQRPRTVGYLHGDGGGDGQRHGLQRRPFERTKPHQNQREQSRYRENARKCVDGAGLSTPGRRYGGGKCDRFRAHPGAAVS